MALNQLQIAKDISGFPTYIINFAGSSSIYTCVLPADTAVSLTIPANSRVAVFGISTASDVWVSTATFAIPSGNTFTATDIYLNPPPLIVKGITTLYFRAPQITSVSVAFYQ